MTQGERVKLIRKEKGLTLEKFGSRLGVGKVAISLIESGKNNLTEQMARSICREFNVNEDWLKTGEGEMFNELSEAEEASAFLGRTMRKNMDSSIRQRLIRILSQLNEDEWILVEKIARKIAQEYSDEKKD